MNRGFIPVGEGTQTWTVNGQIFNSLAEKNGYIQSIKGRLLPAPTKGGKLFGLREWEVAPGQQAKVTKTLQQLEAEYLADTGMRPVVVAADHPQGALGYINPKTGRIEIYFGERFGPAARAEELFHYKQLKARGLLGKTEAEIGPKVIQEMEVEVETMLRNAGFQPRR